MHRPVRARTRYAPPGQELAGCTRHRGAEAAADAVALHRGARPAARWRTPPAAGRRIRRRAKRSETGPARCRRARARASNVARSRTRQIRPRDASGRGRGGPAARRARPRCASGGGSRGSSCASGCWAGTCASRMASSRRSPRGLEVRGPQREAENRQVYGAGANRSQRGAAQRSPRRKPARPLVAHRTPVLRSAPRRRPRPGRRELPR